MTEPATVIDPQTAEVISFTGPTVPATAYRDMEALAAEAVEEKDATVKALAKAERQIRALKREIDDLLEEAADKDTVTACLTYWRTKAGKPKAKIPMSGSRARHCRWVVKTFGGGERGARAFCLAVVGLMRSEWHVANGVVDVSNLCMSAGKYDEARVEKFIAAGKAALKGAEDA